jgi:hypothetical protein
MQSGDGFMKSGEMKSGEESGFDMGKVFDGSLQIMRESADMQ